MIDVLNSKGVTELSEFQSILEKLTVDAKSLNEDEKVLALSYAIIFLKAFFANNHQSSYLELAYFIILRYSLTFKDYEPLFDLATNLGFYPIVQAITAQENQNLGENITPLFCQSISSALIPKRINREFRHGNIIETLEQKNCRNKFISANARSLSYIAPTSFGKSSVIAEHLKKHWDSTNRVAIIVPTKSLLLQTYRLVKKWDLNTKILIHDEMYDKQNCFIGIFTQERALRLLDQNSDLYFDYLYIDEAHNLLECDSRSILLGRLIKLGRVRNPKTQIIYLSPLIGESKNLELPHQENIIEQRIKLHIKEPEYFNFEKNGTALKYNRFLDSFFELKHYQDMFQYIEQNQTKKNFFYLRTPAKIEKFAKELSEKSDEIKEPSNELNTTINLLKKYVHEDFYAVDYLKKGIVYLHGKLPDTIKDYLQFKFSRIENIHTIIANNVILEGINLPIDSLFILSGDGLNKNKLINLIGRVNRLDHIFQNPPQLEKLFPRIHFINSTRYNRKNGNLKNKIQLLRKTSISDELKNPLLKHYDLSKESTKQRKRREKIISHEEIYFATADCGWQQLKKKMISLNMNTIYDFTDDLCKQLFDTIEDSLRQNDQQIHFLDKLQKIFVSPFTSKINDKEFQRLADIKTISYYKHFFENRNKSLREIIELHIERFNQKQRTSNPFLYVGDSFGEVAFLNAPKGKKVYVDLRTKNKKNLVNLAIVKQKIEEDFVSYKLNMFFQLMRDYTILTLNEYNQIIYGSCDSKKISLVKMGLPMNLVNRLDNDDQLKNITINKHGNLETNFNFIAYKDSIDDFLRFELDKFI